MEYAHINLDGMVQYSLRPQSLAVSDCTEYWAAGHYIAIVSVFLNIVKSERMQ